MIRTASPGIIQEGSHLFCDDAACPVPTGCPWCLGINCGLSKQSIWLGGRDRPRAWPEYKSASFLCPYFPCMYTFSACYSDEHMRRTRSTAVCLHLVDISISERRQLQILVSDSFQKCTRSASGPPVAAGRGSTSPATRATSPRGRCSAT